MPMTMTDQERRDAQSELLTMARDLEQWSVDPNGNTDVYNHTRRTRAAMLRAVAAELARGTEGQP